MKRDCRLSLYRNTSLARCFELSNADTVLISAPTHFQPPHAVAEEKRHSDEQQGLPYVRGLTSGSISNPTRASRIARPVHASTAATVSGVMKSCVVREAKTICAAAALMRGFGQRVLPSASVVDTEGGCPCVEDGGGTVIAGATGRVVTGGVTVAVVCVERGQFAARWRMWNVSIYDDNSVRYNRVR